MQIKFCIGFSQRKSYLYVSLIGLVIIHKFGDAQYENNFG